MHWTLPLSMTVFLALAPQDSKPASRPDPTANLRAWQLVFLKPVKPLPKDAPEMAAHMAFLAGLLKDQKAAILGPFGNSTEYAGVLILDVKTPAAAQALMAEEPTVKAGYMAAEVHPWLASGENFGPAANGLQELTACTFGILRRPKDAPDKSPQELDELQKGHLANIVAMAQSGELFGAGPMLENGPIRGLLLFRTTDHKRIRELVARDPAVKAGRLALELLSWTVPKGCFTAAAKDK